MKTLWKWWQRRQIQRRIAYRRAVLAGSGMSTHARRIYEADLWRDMRLLEAYR